MKGGKGDHVAYPFLYSSLTNSILQEFIIFNVEKWIMCKLEVTNWPISTMLGFLLLHVFIILQYSPLHTWVKNARVALNDVIWL